MGIEKKILSTRIDDGILSKLKRLAKMQNRSLSNLIETALKKFLTEDKMKKGLNAFELLTLIGEFLFLEVDQATDITYDKSGEEKFFLKMDNNEVFEITVNKKASS